MNLILKHKTKKQIITEVVSNSKKGVWNGIDETDYFTSCRYWLEFHNATIIFTRDVGHHSGGWWKNPDFERCFHLSISFVDYWGNRKPHNKKEADKIVKMLYGNNSNLVWCEPPYSEQGQKFGVWHYRLFCDINWKAIKPRGEVYNTKFTETGWKSFSELNK